MTLFQKFALVLAVLRGDVGPEAGQVIASALDEIRDIERRAADARKRLEEAAGLSIVTATRDNMTRRPERVDTGGESDAPV